MTLDNGTNQERSLVHPGSHKRPTQLPNHTSKRTLTTSLDGRSWTRCPWLIWGHPGVSVRRDRGALRHFLGAPVEPQRSNIWGHLRRLRGAVNELILTRTDIRRQRPPLCRWRC